MNDTLQTDPSANPTIPTNLANPGATEALLPLVSRSVGGYGVALTILASIAVIGALFFAQPLVVSLLLGILIAYTLNPVVVWLERIGIPRAAGSVVVMLGVAAALGFGSYALRGQIHSVVDQLPAAASRFAREFDSLRRGPANALQNVQAAASTLQNSTSQVGEAAAPQKPATRVVVEPPVFKLSTLLWQGSMGVAGLVGQVAMVLFLTFFLLLSGDTYKRKLVRLAGPTLAHRKITVHILDDINESIQRYMFMLLATNLLVGVLTWIALSWIGLENAGAWAAAAGLLHLIPYFGPAVTAVGLGMIAFLQFGNLSSALLVAATSLLLATLVGTFITTWMTGRIARMNTAAVFVSLLFWAWLWGVWGMLLSIPITAIIKVVTQHVPQFEAVAELLGE